MAEHGQGWRRRRIPRRSPTAVPDGRGGAGSPGSSGSPLPAPTAATVGSPRAAGRDPAPPDPASAYLASLGEGSQRTMREALDKLADWASAGRCDLHDLPWHLLRIEHTAALRTRLAATLAPATANKHMAALRGVLKQCSRQELLSAEDYRRITTLPPIRGEASRRAAVLADEDFARIARVCHEDESPAGARDEALLSLLRVEKLRRAEVVALDLADYDARGGRLKAGATGREIELSRGIQRALARWLALRGDAPGPLFEPVNKGGRIEPRRLSEQAIYIACQKRATAAGLPPTSPEDLRRASAGA